MFTTAKSSLMSSIPSQKTMKSTHNMGMNSPNYTPEQSFVLAMPSKNYLSEAMQRTYMDKVRSIQNNSLLKKPYRIDTERIIEHTVGEGGTIDSDEVKDDFLSLTSQRRFITGLMHELQEQRIDDADFLPAAKLSY